MEKTHEIEIKQTETKATTSTQHNSEQNPSEIKSEINGQTSDRWLCVVIRLNKCLNDDDDDEKHPRVHNNTNQVNAHRNEKTNKSSTTLIGRSNKHISFVCLYVR